MPAVRVLNNDMTGSAPNRPVAPASNDDGTPDFNALLTAVGTARDKDAFVALFQHFAPRVKSYLLKQGATDAQADEITQNTMITVWDRAAQFDAAKASASTWIFTIARNKRIDSFRREQRPELPMLEDVSLPDPMQNTGARLEKKETDDILKREIAKLPSEQAEMLRLAYFEGKTHDMIAKERNIPIGTVKSRLRLALGKLRSVLSPADHHTGKDQPA